MMNWQTAAGEGGATCCRVAMCAASRGKLIAQRVLCCRKIFFDLCILKLSYCSPRFFIFQLWDGRGSARGCRSKVARKFFAFPHPHTHPRTCSWQAACPITMNGRGRGKHEHELHVCLLASFPCICATLIELNICEELPDNLKWKCEHQLALPVFKFCYASSAPCHVGAVTWRLCVSCVDLKRFALDSNIARANRQCTSRERERGKEREGERQSEATCKPLCLCQHCASTN